MNIRRRRRSDRGLNVVPLIDVVFQLLIFFMLTSKFITQTSHNIALPKSMIDRKLHKEPIVLHVTRERDVFVNKEKVPTPLAELQDRLRGELSHFEKPPGVVIKGDENVTLGLTIRLLDIVKAAGGESVDITTIKAGEKP